MSNHTTERQQATLTDYLRALPLYLVPHHALSRLMHWYTRITYAPVKNWSIDLIVRRYAVDMSEALEPDPLAYPTFNSFFTRALKPETRPIVDGPSDIACPVDGFVSQIGSIEDGRIFQAKGRDYTLLELLGGSETHAAPFRGGQFATLYLSPRDYHRIHSPFAGELKSMMHVPGRLFSVSPQTTRAVPRLFARNERVILFFDTDAGPMAVILVGAIFVASIETVWTGEVTPPTRHDIKVWDYAEKGIRCGRGEEIGRFNMGSTVIVLFAKDRAEWTPEVGPGARIKMGQRLGTSRT